jgi:hypothetical protein
LFEKLLGYQRKADFALSKLGGNSPAITLLVGVILLLLTKSRMHGAEIQLVCNNVWMFL